MTSLVIHNLFEQPHYQFPEAGPLETDSEAVQVVVVDRVVVLVGVDEDPAGHLEIHTCSTERVLKLLKSNKFEVKARTSGPYLKKDVTKTCIMLKLSWNLKKQLLHSMEISGTIE